MGVPDAASAGSIALCTERPEDGAVFQLGAVQTVVPEGEVLMPAGTSAVLFSCSLISEDAPDVVIRFMTLGEPETVEVR